MEIQFFYTKHQVARGSRPDAEAWDALYLIKNVSELRATYQIRLLAYRATQERKKLVIRLPRGAKLHRTLRELRKQSAGVILVERTSAFRL
jgi:hypothetical protein